MSELGRERERGWQNANMNPKEEGGREQGDGGWREGAGEERVSSERKGEGRKQRLSS